MTATLSTPGQLELQEVVPSTNLTDLGDLITSTPGGTYRMPLKLNVGVSKKLGLPDYSSIGASCQLELELEAGVLRDLEGFHEQVRDAFVAAHQAVNDELVRLQTQANQASGSAPAVPGHEPDPREARRHGKVNPGVEVTRSWPNQVATPNQVRAIITIARRQQADLQGLLNELGATRPEDLSIAEASRLIDQLKAASAF